MKCALFLLFLILNEPHCRTLHKNQHSVICFREKELYGTGTYILFNCFLPSY